MKKQAILVAPILLCMGALALWSSDDISEREALSENQAAADISDTPQYEPKAGDNDILIAQQTAPNFKLRNEVISEHIVFESTQEYEAASRYGALPSHMTDIAIERFTLNEAGELVVNEKIKNIIEYFLMAAHIEGREQAIARIHEYIELNLSGEAAEEAATITNNYLLYKDNLNTQQFSMSTDFNQQENLNMLRAALDDKKQTRREYLGEIVSEALFGHEERYDDFSYQRLAINSDPTLSEAEKDQMMAQAESQLPSKMAQDMRYKREEKKLTAKINALKGETGNEQEIYTLRENFYGEKIAKRMQYLESNTPEWQARVAEFRQLQQDIMASEDLNDEAKLIAIKEAKQNAFTPKEQVKLAVQSIRGTIASL